MATVYVKNGDVEQAIKKLRKKVEAEGILNEYRNRMYYKSKGVIRREKMKAAIKKQRRENYIQLNLNNTLD